jgi:hypothetical protein
MAKRKYNLVGIDGNAFSVMGYVRSAMKAEGFSQKEIEAYTKDAMSSDYSYLISVSCDMIDECNARRR